MAVTGRPTSKRNARQSVLHANAAASAAEDISSKAAAIAGRTSIFIRSDNETLKSIRASRANLFNNNAASTSQIQPSPPLSLKPTSTRRPPPSSMPPVFKSRGSQDPKLPEKLSLPLTPLYSTLPRVMIRKNSPRLASPPHPGLHPGLHPGTGSPRRRGGLLRIRGHPDHGRNIIDALHRERTKHDPITGFHQEQSASGALSEGEFFNGKLHGEGKRIEATGERYEGQWKEGMKYGAGRWLSIGTTFSKESFPLPPNHNIYSNFH